MAFIPALGTIQAEVRATYLGIPIENVLHFTSGDESVPPGDIVGVASSLANAWVANVLADVVETYTMREIFAFDMTVAAGVMATDTTVAGAPGALTNAGMPGSVAFCVSLRTPQRGRSFRGRVYIAGLSETDVTGNFLEGTRAANLVGDIQAVRDAVFSDTGYSLAIVSTRTGGAPRTVAEVTPVTSILSTTTRVTSQRRRLT